MLYSLYTWRRSKWSEEKSYSVNYFQNKNCDASENDLIAYKPNLYNSNPTEGQ
jgi:hypothetical protein